MKTKHTIHEMKKLALDKGGACLAREYVNASTKLLWKCTKGHTWESAPRTVMAGAWCPECAHQKRNKFSLADIKAIAKERGGKCLSKEYCGSSLDWRCENGHEWQAAPRKVAAGSWCPECFESNRHKYTLEDMQNLAKKKGGSCLSKTYSIGQMKWKCGTGHTWEATARTIRAGCWCPTCEDLSRRKYTLTDMKELAKQKGGSCLAKSFSSVNQSLDWKCKNGHTWHAVAYEVLRGRWCRECAHEKRRLSIDSMKNWAIGKGGVCLSERYFNKDTNLCWRCSEGHEWMATPGNVINSGTWCLECSGHRKKTIADMQQAAKAKNGLCVSTQYVNSSTPMEWECEKKHRWLARPTNVINQNQWCPKCAGITKGSLDELKLLAKSRGGLCLASRYDNSNTKVQWKCSNGHIWYQTPNVVKNMSAWCPECPKQFREEICRAIFCTLFRAPFPRQFPSFLQQTPGKIGLQLDGFNDDLGIAFEHQGLQHYLRSIFGQSLESFEKLQARDVRKAELCKKYGIALVTIPELISSTPINAAQELIADQLIKQGISLPSWYWDVKIRLDDLVRENGPQLYAKPVLTELAKICSDRGGLCLSTTYKGGREKLEFQCAQGHTWMATPESIKQGTWCVKCAGLSRKTIEQMQELARVRGGSCLSADYKGNHGPLKWQCSKLHIWQAAPADVQGTQRKKGSWCPTCAGRKKSIVDLQLLAIERGGKCLSETYLGYRVKHRWLCEKKHQWEAIANSIQNGTWCPHCARGSL